MTYKEYKETSLARNPELRKEYEALAPQYEKIDSVVATSIERRLTQAELAEHAETNQSNINHF